MRSTSYRVYIGTSGWQYRDWNGRFYPADVKGKSQLGYYARHFGTVEVNNTFYHMPRQDSIINWAESVPDDFSFVIKMNRFLTHTKRLIPDEQFTQRLYEFYRLLKPLKDKLAVVLVQLSPSQRMDASRLEQLAIQTVKIGKKLGLKIPLAIEFRNSSWLDDEIFSLMRRYNLANVINDSPNRWPATKEITADFAYIRFHGSKRPYTSSYSDKELEAWADFIRNEAADCSKIFCYFNNDYRATAVRNAKTFIRFLSND